jgi:hypothetical protein
MLKMDENQQQRLDELNGEGLEIDPKATPLEFLQTVYRNPKQPMQRRLKAAIEAPEYVHPRLAVTATINSGDFATQLDQAVERSRMVLMIEAKANVSDNANVPSDTRSPHVQALNGGKPSVPDRRYRRW